MYVNWLYRWYSVNRFNYGISYFPILFAYIFLKKIVKFNKIEKIVDQIREENIRGGMKYF